MLTFLRFRCCVHTWSDHAIWSIHLFVSLAPLWCWLICGGGLHLLRFMACDVVWRDRFFLKPFSAIEGVIQQQHPLIFAFWKVQDTHINSRRLCLALQGWFIQHRSSSSSTATGYARCCFHVLWPMYRYCAVSLQLLLLFILSSHRGPCSLWSTFTDRKALPLCYKQWKEKGCWYRTSFEMKWFLSGTHVIKCHKNAWVFEKCMNLEYSLFISETFTWRRCWIQPY